MYYTIMLWNSSNHLQPPNLASIPRFFFFSSLTLGVRELIELWKELVGDG